MSEEHLKARNPIMLGRDGRHGTRGLSESCRPARDFICLFSLPAVCARRLGMYTHDFVVLRMCKIHLDSSNIVCLFELIHTGEVSQHFWVHSYQRRCQYVTDSCVSNVFLVWVKSLRPNVSWPPPEDSSQDSTNQARSAHQPHPHTPFV